MRTLGVITTGVIVASALLGAAVGLRSIPDLKRYLRMRSM